MSIEAVLWSCKEGRNIGRTGTSRPVLPLKWSTLYRSAEAEEVPLSSYDDDGEECPDRSPSERDRLISVLVVVPVESTKSCKGMRRLARASAAYAKEMQNFTRICAVLLEALGLIMSPLL